MKAARIEASVSRFPRQDRKTRKPFLQERVTLFAYDGADLEGAPPLAVRGHDGYRELLDDLAANGYDAVTLSWAHEPLALDEALNVPPPSEQGAAA